MLWIYLVFMIGWVHQGISIEEERKALLEIKASLLEASNSYALGVENLLPSWVVGEGSSYCDWERIKCNSTFSDGHSYVTDLSLGNIFSLELEDGWDKYLVLK
ncbi:hypothetical protein E3N88_23229 [Mikania micrantha]|uniref:Leucine-rich repeat-containing N-terminal plant-type domain-containing protein n=1 Tax=Mikania micrantha TaxID=192012 RepID=A0A5N6NFD9_9ASTR|nr:hypothetical protein E3N88_23229 [Mikania micrantha]